MKKLIFRLAQVLCCLSFILMLLQYSLVLKYAKEGLFVWVSCVLPLLLPFIILSKFWIRYEIPQLFFKQVHRLVPAGTTIAISLPVFLLGLCSGFPVGAIFISHYYQQNLLNKRQAESLLPLASFVSPMFVAGYVRSQINLQERLWIYYLLCLYLPVLLCYLLLLIPDSHISAIYHRQKKRRQASSSSFARKDSAKSVTKLSNKKPPALSLSEEVFLPSLEIIFIIGIYMMIFSILSGMLTSFPLFQAPVFTFVLANLEVTTGIHLLALKPFITPQIQYALFWRVMYYGPGPDSSLCYRSVFKKIYCYKDRDCFCELSSMPNSFMLTFCLYIFSINKGRFSSLFFLPYLAKGYTFYFPLKNCFLLLERVR